MNKKSLSKATLPATVLCAIMASNQVVAAELEEVIVTARKQSESLQSVPISVQAFTEKAMENRGIESSADIGNFVSNVQFDTSSSFAGTSTFQGYIRGVGQSDFAINTDPGVGVYVDGIYYARASSSVLGMMDVERIEVLKGPQGTLFGRNTIGGAINVITKKPSDENSFSIKATVGENARADLSFSANAALSETVMVSFAALTENRDGYMDRIPFPGANTGGGGPRLDQILVTGSNASDDDELGGISTDSARAKLLWVMSDSVEATFAADYTDSDSNATPITLLNAEKDLAAPGGVAPLFNGCVAGAPIPPCATSPFLAGELLPFDNRFLTGDIDKTYGNGANFSRSTDYGVSATFNWEVSDSLSIKSITAYREIDQEFGLDLDSSPAIFDQTTFTIEQDQVSQEFQLLKTFDNMKFTVGAYYFTEEATQEDNVPVAGGLVQVSGDNSQEVDSYAFFGELDYAITDAVNLVFGLRYTEEEKTLFLNQQSLNPDFFLSVGIPSVAFPRADLTFLGPEEPQKAEYENVSGRVGVNWQVNDDLFIYATFSQGFKSGGFTTRLTAPFNAELAIGGLTSLDFDEETVDSFEVGFKSELFDNRVRLNGAVFFNTYEDIQIVVQRGITPANENAGEAEMRGFEIELEAVPTDNLTLSATFGYIDAEYTELNPILAMPAFGAVTEDHELPNTPETSASLTINWELPQLMPTGTTALNISYSFTDEVYNDSENTEELFEGSTGISNASLNWESDDRKWNVRLGVNNLSDERRLVSGFNAGSLNFVAGSYNRPREWYLTVGYDY